MHFRTICILLAVLWLTASVGAPVLEGAGTLSKAAVFTGGGGPQPTLAARVTRPVALAPAQLQVFFGMPVGPTSFTLDVQHPYVPGGGWLYLSRATHVSGKGNYSILSDFDDSIVFVHLALPAGQYAVDCSVQGSTMKLEGPGSALTVNTTETGGHVLFLFNSDGSEASFKLSTSYHATFWGCEVKPVQ